MKPPRLIGLTAPSGIAMDGTRGATLLEQAEQAHWFRPGRSVGGKYQNGSVRWSSAKSTPSSKRPEWTLQECALACAGLPGHIHFALRFTFALDDAAVWSLRQVLVSFAEARQKIEGWPATVLRLGIENTYLPDLVDMALLEERQPSRFIGGDGHTLGRPANLRPILLGVEPHVWRRQLSAKYETIRTEYGCWLAIGIAHMRRRLREHQ